MSKRYGRNQKRRHREEIAGLSREVCDQKVLYHRTFDRSIWLFEEHKRIVNETLGPLSIFHLELAHNVCHENETQMYVSHPTHDLRFMDMDIDENMGAITVNLESFRVELESEVEDGNLRLQIAFISSLGGGARYQYFVSEDLRKARGFDERMVVPLADEIAHKLIKVLKET